MNHSVELQPMAATLAFEESFSQQEAQPANPSPKQECVRQLANTVKLQTQQQKHFCD